jgi:methyl-accepting chemotaxis protein
VVTVPLERLARAAAGIAAGDLRQQIDTRGSDEIGELARSFSKMAGTVTHLLTDLRSAAADIEREATSALTTSTQQSAMAHEQASAINETSTTVAEIAQTSKQATTYADSVISGTQRSEALSTEGQKVVAESVAGMEKLGEQVRTIALAITELNERTLQISDIITTVRDVAEQSNLLALNASIEAAKAGDHGRGFAVVAMEMRTLAEQSKVAANQVRALLGEVQKGTKAAVAATDEGSRRAQAAMALAQSAGSAILGLAEVIRESSGAARQIAGNTRQQTIGVEQIATAMSELSAAMTDTVSGTRQIEQVAGNLTNLSKRFSELVGRYQL